MDKIPGLICDHFSMAEAAPKCWKSQLIRGLYGTESSSRLPQTSACPIRAGLPHHRNEQSSDLSAQRQMVVGLQLRRRHLPRPLAEMGDTVILWAIGVAFMAVYAEYYVLAGSNLCHYLWLLAKRKTTKHNGLPRYRYHFGQIAASTTLDSLLFCYGLAFPVPSQRTFGARW
ncbi:unnamed protein product [Penicillium nalgiovense]|nr:unnamed protein product [Penicillium nalgiovense]